VFRPVIGMELEGEVTAVEQERSRCRIFQAFEVQVANNTQVRHSRDDLTRLRKYFDNKIA
jgi:hypothetical protein